MDRLAFSALDWWEEAGVDTFVDETPRDWLARPKTPEAEAPAPEGSSPKKTAEAPIAPPAPAITLPDTLAELRAWLLSDPAVPGRATARLDAMGDAASGSALLVDMPEMEDRGRTLLSGDAGALLDRMLTAMGLSREAVYLLPFSPARPLSGTLDAKSVAQLLPIARHHLKLVAPKRLLVMGEAPTRALLGLGCNEARGRVHLIDLDGTSVPVVATFPPRFIVQASQDELKARRATVWADLQLFMSL